MSIALSTGLGAAAHHAAARAALAAAEPSRKAEVDTAASAADTAGATPGRTLQQLNEDTATLRAQFTRRGVGSDTPPPAPMSAFVDQITQSLTAQLAQERAVKVTQTGNSVVIETGSADDRVDVSRDAATGDVTVTTNGTAQRFAATQAEHITIRTGDGDDVVNVAPDMQNNLTIEGGDGNDILAGGAGADHIDGGAGDDIVVGGAGSDELVGGSGNDTLSDQVGILDANLWLKGVAIRSGGGNDVAQGGDGDDSIRTGDGDDTVRAGAGDDTVDSGDGQDRVFGDGGDDRIQAGAGHDQVHGGDGDDYVDGFTGHDQIDGDAGADTLYGGEGNDLVDGGEGQDYVDGYLGDDTLAGGAGNDVISGGQGDDALFGDAGNDVVYAGKGRDLIADYEGTNSVFHQGEDSLVVNDETRANAQTRVVDVAEVPANIAVDGSAAFEARMHADLETLAASPTGRQMLDTIGGISGRGSHTLKITELAAENGRGGGTFGADGFAEINPAFHLDDDDGRVPPITVLYHELGHARAAMANVWPSGQFADAADPGNPDTGIENAERQAVGLPIDHDGDPSTPAIVDPNTPAALTENAIRAEMGYGPRADYR